MNKPAFTTNPYRIKRLQENYTEGVQRERVPCAIREKLDLELLAMSRDKLKFLFQNAMESYSAEEKNKKVHEFNTSHATEARRGSWKFLHFA